jgi:hypothetical protein
MAASGASFGGNTPFGNVPAALPGIFQGLTGDSGAPFREAGEAYKPYADEATAAQNPFANLGKSAIPQFQDYLSTMKDPNAFVNHIMQNYSQSPWARNLQQASIRAGQNAGSADGTYGSTPLALQLQQNASQISSADQNNWLQNVLGVNKTYGEGLGTELNTGQHATDELSSLFNTEGQNLGQAAYGEKAGENQDKGAFWAGVSKLLGG